MIQELEIKKYRKLVNINLKFDMDINIISGSNGTCKSSLLHIISNSFQSLNKNNRPILDSNCLDILKKINKLNNPKIESLTRGDKEYNDPAPGEKGVLFKTKYYNETELNFRKHNSTKDEKHRFAIKPRYVKGENESLPALPIIYLGLFRLFSFGEFDNDNELKNLGKKLPEEYSLELEKLYKDFTGVKIQLNNTHDMGGIKNRADFSSEINGIDSNTISAGEDNLFIILTALISLKYYFKNITSMDKIESILLIDELDATLHPAYQVKLFDLFKEFSKKYKIQIIFTTHSLNLLEYALKKKTNVIYLLNQMTYVNQMTDVNKYKIEANLKNELSKDIYLNKYIPIFTEDNEARVFLNCIFEYFSENYSEFSKVEKRFHLVEANLACEALKSIFSDDKILRTTLGSICILDGDQQKNITNHIITLPGKKSPEDFIFEYAEKISSENTEFWQDEFIENQGYTNEYYVTKIKPEIEEINYKLEELRNANESTHGKKREYNKNVFNNHKEFFTCLMKYWLNHDENRDSINKFYKDLNILFKKVAEFNNIDSNNWNI